MATKDTLRLLKKNNFLKLSLQACIDDLETLRKEIEDNKGKYNPSSADSVALKDVFHVLEKRNQKTLA